MQAVVEKTRPIAPDQMLLPLVPGRLYALQNTMSLDGRVAAYPASARGYATVNCYLLTEPDAALMLDTGFTVHRSAILDGVEQIIGRDKPLTLFPLRLNELMSLSNTMALAQRFPVDGCISVLKDAAYHVDLESILPNDIADAAGRLRTHLVAGNEWLNVGPGDGRPIKLFQSPVRLIATRWVHDPAARALFTSDMFTGTWGADPGGPWIVDETNDDMTAAEMEAFMLNTRYWWLRGAKTDALRRGLGELYAKCGDVEILAPGYGKIFKGSAVIARQFALLDEVLRRLDRSRMPQRYVSRDEEF
ncbi:hypothetical protein [Acidisphaera sp. L21]|uniref:hypothetical protein n=1 Tax=Acidisphaera sp. L21 TaxID=1641851 RepID=UPI00131D83AE|nr:hypothetical protein [Acidisphaera sp. L21]